MRKIIEIILVFSFFATPAYGNEVHQLIEDAKNNIEGTEAERETIGAHVGAWLSNFDFNRLAHQAHRWALVKQHEPGMRDHVLNLAFLFPASHFTEMVAGPISAGLNEFLNGPEWITGTLLATGTLISIPGFVDPVCILLFVSYKHMGFQKFVTKVRLSVTRVTANTIGRIVLPFFERFNPLASLKNLKTISLETSDINGVAHLSRIKIDRQVSESDWNVIRRHYRKLGWNIGGLFNDLRRGRANSYVTSTHSSDGHLILDLNPLAFPVGNALRLRNPFCGLSFRR